MKDDVSVVSHLSNNIKAAYLKKKSKIKLQEGYGMSEQTNQVSVCENKKVGMAVTKLHKQAC